MTSQVQTGKFSIGGWQVKYKLVNFPLEDDMSSTMPSAIRYWMPWTVQHRPLKCTSEVPLCREACQDTQTNIRLASHLLECRRTCITRGTDYCWEIPGVRSFYSDDPNVIMSCLTCSTLSVWLPNARCIHNDRSLEHHLSNATSLHPNAVPTMYSRELCREACRDTQTSIRLASHLVRAPNSRSRGHELEFPVHWLKSEDTWVRSSIWSEKIHIVHYTHTKENLLYLLSFLFGKKRVRILNCSKH